MENQLNITELPYSDRQLVIVTEDDAVIASREAEKITLSGKNGIDWEKIGDIAIKLVLGRTGELIAEVTKEAIRAWSRARENGVNILQIGKSEAQQIIFPIGHPREGLLYIGHPAKADVYYTIADFHRITFEHKFCEAIDLLMSLGANKLKVEHVAGWSNELSVKLAVPFGANHKISGELENSQKSTSQVLYEATLSGLKTPSLPENLVWFPHEPTWQSIAKGRLEYGLLNFNLSVTYEDDFGVNAGLKLIVQKSGLDLGGKFEDHQATVWRIAGTFNEGKETA